MNHYGVILRKLRELKRLSLKMAAKRIERSAGWLSEIENGKGAARIHPQEFERIVAVYEGEAYRKQFGIWVAQANKPVASPKEVQFTGPVLRYLREKLNLSLADAASQAGVSASYLSYLETGVKPLRNGLRDRLFMRLMAIAPQASKTLRPKTRDQRTSPRDTSWEFYFGI